MVLFIEMLMNNHEFFSKHPLIYVISLKHIFIISDPRRGCYMGLSNVLFSFFFSFFFRHDFVRPISLEPLLAETPNWVCCLVLRSSCALLVTIQFASLFFFSLIFFFFFRQDFVRAISLEPLLAETPNWVCCLVLRSSCALLLTIQFALFYLFIFFSPPRFCHDFVRAISREPLLAETPNWVCCLALRSNCALLLTIQFALYIFFFSPPRFCLGHISGTVTRRDSKLSVLLGPAV